MADRLPANIFPWLGDRPMSENTVLAVLRRMGYGKDKMTGHGFRSVVSTLQLERGYPSHVIEAQLAHAERNAVKAAYNRAAYLSDRRKLMQDWADYLDGLRHDSCPRDAGRVGQQRGTIQSTQSPERPR